MATLLLIAGGGLIAAGQIQEGRVAEAQGKFAKQIAVRNQQALERQAKAEQDAAGIEESRAARQEKIFKAGQRAVAGKTGGQIAGATLSLLADAARQFSIERNLILRRGLIVGQELRERGQIQLAKGRFARSTGKAIKRASFIKAGGTVLTAFGASGIGGGSGPTPLKNQGISGPTAFA